MSRITNYFFIGSLLVASLNGQAIRPGFDSNSLAANDDLSTTSAIPFGFTFNFYGNVTSEAFLNNNGNITLDAPLGTFSPSQTDFSLTPIIAPFYGDVDTTGAGSNLMTYAQGTLFGRPAFAVNWVDVGFYDSRDDLLNSFQLVLIDRSDIGSGNFDMEFNYGQIQWETGEASGGVDGLGGDSARVGYSNGIGTLEEIEGSGINGALLDGGPNALTGFTNIGTPGRFVTLVRNGEVIVIEIVTEEAVATIKDSASSFASLSTRNINDRLLRMRAGLENADHDRLSYDHSGGNESLSDIGVEVFGSYDFHSLTIGERNLSNAGGLMMSTVPEAELNMQVASAGVEFSLTNSFRAGAAALFSTGDVSHADDTLDADLDSQGFAGYLTWYLEDLAKGTDVYLDILYANMSGEMSTTRGNPNDYIGSAGNTGKTDMNADELTLNAGVIFENRNTRHGPYAQFSMKESSVDGFTELGGSADTIPEVKSESRMLELGYQVNFNLEAGLGSLRPHLRLAYEKEFEDQEITVNTLSLGALPDDAVVLGGGVTYDAGLGMYISLDTEYRYLDSDTSSFSAFLNFGYQFW